MNRDFLIFYSTSKYFPILGIQWAALGVEVAGGGKGLDTVTLPSSPAQEKLRYLQRQLQDETPRRQEAELQELEQKLDAGLSRHSLGPTTQSPGCCGPPGNPDEPPRPRSMAPGGWGMGPRAGEGPIVSEQEMQKVSAGLEELRRVGQGGGAARSLKELKWVGLRVEPRRS